jgi:hypothetical protein
VVASSPSGGNVVPGSHAPMPPMLEKIAARHEFLEIESFSV